CRLELGVGAGWTTADYEAAGFPLDRPGVRIARLDEALQVLRGLWSEGPCTFAGEHYRITGLDGLPKPHRAGGPPLVVGGGGERWGISYLGLSGDQLDAFAPVVAKLVGT